MHKRWAYLDVDVCFSLLQGKVFAFDRVLKPNVSQEYVYTVVAKPIVAGKYGRVSQLQGQNHSSCPITIHKVLSVIQYKVLQNGQ